MCYTHEVYNLTSVLISTLQEIRLAFQYTTLHLTYKEKFQNLPKLWILFRQHQCNLICKLQINCFRNPGHRREKQVIYLHMRIWICCTIKPEEQADILMRLDKCLAQARRWQIHILPATHLALSYSILDESNQHLNQQQLIHEQKIKLKSYGERSVKKYLNNMNETIFKCDNGVYPG